MYQSFTREDVTYEEAARGWVDGVYYPREEHTRAGSGFLEEKDGALKLHSRVWQEIEETGYGVYYYEETTCLVTELPGSNYVVKTVFFNPTDAPYRCHIRLNNVVKKDSIILEPGEEKEITFIACMTDGSFRLSFPAGSMPDIHGGVLEDDVYIKDIEIVEEASKERRKKPHVFLISDSTVQSYEKRFYPQTGWGQVFYQYFEGAEDYQVYRAEGSDYSLAKTYELPELAIENRSIGGRSARSFYDEGKLDQALEVICPGDFMFVQFAHNDNTAIRPNRYIPVDDFPKYLQRYVDACARRNVQCVLVTPVTMRIFDEEGRFKIAFNNYREKMMEMAREQNLPLLDLAERSTAYLNQIGEEESKNIYLWVEEGEYPDGAYAAGVSDRAHLQEYGAKIYANIVAELIAEYQEDNRLDVLKKLVRPKQASQIEKPRKVKDTSGKVHVEVPDAVSGFVVQEISVENGRGSFLLNWNRMEDAVSYSVYAKKMDELTFEVVRTVTAEEKEVYATFPFSTEAGYLWQYYVVAVFKNGSEGHASRMVEVDLR